MNARLAKPTREIIEIKQRNIESDLLTAILYICHLEPAARAAEARPWHRFACLSASFPVSHSRGLTSSLSFTGRKPRRRCSVSETSPSETAGCPSMLREDLRSLDRVHRFILSPEFSSHSRRRRSFQINNLYLHASRYKKCIFFAGP